MSEYRLQGRGGKGIINYHIDRNGLVAGVRAVQPEDEVFIISDDGVIIRIPADQIAQQSRYGGGVWVMRLAEGSRVVTLACAPAEEDDDDDDQNDDEQNGDDQNDDNQTTPADEDEEL